ncbi:DNA glycosylase family protein [Micromonospora zhanjiangensis]|uniref:DNA-3-methyladenine glycosylase II n=1 Tax=Micromonospora zhanjiangensis TaxID=1522057 RepID=A0ABV8KMF9_9ACTN
MKFDLLLTDHPSWRPSGGGFRRVLSVDSGTAWLVEVREGRPTWTLLDGVAPPPSPDVFATSRSSGRRASPIAAPLAQLGRVGRLRNPSLWDALATAIVRQVIRAAQARLLYRNFCDAYGPRIALSDHTDIRSFPSPADVIALSDGDFTQCGMAFKRRPLRHAAEAFLDRGETWSQLSPSVLVKELQTIPGVGPWSAGAAVADWSNDWSLYPYGDLAVRTWARHAAPDHPWPADEAAFARMWRQVTGDHLASLTLLTLAWAGRHGGSV